MGTGGRPSIADRINAAHVECEKSLRASVEHAICAGELLLEAKKTIGHGDWTAWLAENIKFSDRLAQAYMRIARLPVKSATPLRICRCARRCRQFAAARGCSPIGKSESGTSHDCAFEGADGFKKRAAAFRQRHGIATDTNIPFYLMPTRLVTLECMKDGQEGITIASRLEQVELGPMTTAIRSPAAWSCPPK
jgi:Protein of unknown function (DUF3102)